MLQELVPEYDLVAMIPERLERRTSHVRDEHVSYSGYIDNLYCSVRKQGLNIKGSLSKFILGNNYTNLGSEACAHAFEILSNRLSIPLLKAKLTQIDIGLTIECEHAPTRYFKYLGSSKYFKSRSVNNTTLSYSNTSRSKLFYDKIKELKKRGSPLPEDLIGKQFVRFETRYRKCPNKYFKRNGLLVNDLLHSSLFEEFKSNVLYEFNSINRIRHTTLDTTLVNKASDFKNFIAADAIAKHGLPYYLNLIEDTMLDSQNRTRAKAYCKDLASSFVTDVQTDLYDELSSKLHASLSAI